MNSVVSYLQPGDLIQIVAPAKEIEASFVEYATKFFVDVGYRVKVSMHCLGRYYYFSGTDHQRIIDFQEAIDDPEVKAIVCARGGYGSVRIVDKIGWASQLRNPKWIIGYSDITVFHQQMQRFGLPSIHATMPLNFADNTVEALNTLLYALNGTTYYIKHITHPSNKFGSVVGEIVGGNLSVVCSFIGTDSQPSYKDKILFLEEIGEELYKIDRMFFLLKKSGVLDVISGLIIGGFTSCVDAVSSTLGLTLEEIVLQHFEYIKIPICFDFPSGHINDNRALVFGELAHFDVNSQGVELIFPRT